MSYSIKLIKEEKELHFTIPEATKAVSTALLPKVLSIFEPSTDKELYKKRLVFLGALIAAELDTLEVVA
jgi:hypothetical protein